MKYLSPEDYRHFRRLWMLKRGDVSEMVKAWGKCRATIYRIARKLKLPHRYEIINELMKK